MQSEDLQLLEQLNEEVEKITDGIRKSYSKQEGEHIQRLQSAIEAIHTGESIVDRGLLKKLGIDLAGIHYTSEKKVWLPIILMIGHGETECYKRAIPVFGVNNHFAMMQSEKEFTVMIPSEFFKLEEIKAIAILLKDVENIDQTIIQKISEYHILASHIEKWRFVPAGVKEDFQKLENFSLMVATSCFLTLRLQDSSHNIYIYHHPLMGGVATVSVKTFKEEESEKLHEILRRRMILISLMDGYLKSYKEDYQHYDDADVLKGSFKSDLKNATLGYIANIQLPKDKLKGKLDIDYFSPITVIKRFGNKKKQAEFRIILRINVLSNDAFNFLYADNAMIFNRIEEYLNGWIQGYFKKFQEGCPPDKIKLRLDVYVSPEVKDVEARKVNLYDPGEIQVEENSNFYIWYKSIFDKEPPNLMIPAVIYRFSEMVGPSIFVGEISSAILRHYVSCDSCCQQKPINVLNLFSGTLACELTVIKRLKDCLRNPENILPVSFQCIDSNPYPLPAKQITDQVEEVKRYVHIVPADIFALFSHLEKDPKPMYNSNDIYSKGYDLVIADPPHYLTLDYLYQRVRWIKNQEKDEKIVIDNTLFEHLVKNGKVKSFVLYFAHKEKEWMGFFIHRILTKAGWPEVWSILIGDERIIVCFNKKLEEVCKNGIIKYIDELEKSYRLEDKPFNINVYDTIYRKLK